MNIIREFERPEATAITDDELLSTVDALRTAADTSRGAAQRVVGAARNAIMGRPVTSVASWRETLAAVSAADVHEVAKEAFGSSLFVLPPKEPAVPRGVHPARRILGHGRDGPLDPQRRLSTGPGAPDHRRRRGEPRSGAGRRHRALRAVRGAPAMAGRWAPAHRPRRGRSACPTGPRRRCLARGRAGQPG
jgi:hypothetical protein